MASLDASLDDMIRYRRNSERGRGRGMAWRGRGRGGSFSGRRMTGAPRRGPFGLNARPSSYAIAKSFRRTTNFPWQRDLVEDSLRAVGVSGTENGTKLYISNLDVGVSNEDIRELFAEIGDLKRFAVHYDKTGRSSGSAEVVFVRRSDAFQALRRYNNVQLDGKPMKIEIIGTNSDIPVSARVKLPRLHRRSLKPTPSTSMINHQAFKFGLLLDWPLSPPPALKLVVASSPASSPIAVVGRHRPYPPPVFLWGSCNRSEFGVLLSGITFWDVPKLDHYWRQGRQLEIAPNKERMILLSGFIIYLFLLLVMARRVDSLGRLFGEWESVYGDVGLGVTA
ncbi:THO complex subunit 4D-like [Diospyros lotus]|uniref:THO complex subunit 4D-like n=1 Tax=Diospyros lotus TaxID=55363 RepID=UPI00224F115C|nr:THO complex subunit 4D-like [Diospyros lotus]